MMTHNVVVDFDVPNNRFLVTCSFMQAGVARGFPNSRWNKKLGQWVVPKVRANVSYIEETAIPSGCVLTPAARQAISDYKSAAVAPPHRPFPADYPFKTTPKPKQMEAIAWAYRRPAVGLFMEMRTGKTKVAIDLLTEAFLAGKIDRVLVVCPITIRKNWLLEIAVHAPVPVDAFLLDTTKRKAFYRWVEAPSGSVPASGGRAFKWLFVGVESLSTGSAEGCAKMFLEAGVGAMAVDESSDIKDHAAKHAKACVRLARLSAQRILMTGTPIGQGIMDLFMQFEVIDPEILGFGDFYSFRNRYAIMGGYEVEDARGKKHKTEVIGYQNLDELMELIQPYVFQASQEDVYGPLPPVVRTTYSVTLNQEQRTLYDGIRRRGEATVGLSTLSVKNTLGKLLRLQQIAGGFVSFPIENLQDDTKPQRYRSEAIAGVPAKLVGLHAILSGGPRPNAGMIIWCSFAAEIALVADSLRNRYGTHEVVEMHGGVSEDDRARNVALFQAGTATFLVGNVSTGGVGLTLSRADTVIFYSDTFNYIDRVQGEQRAFLASRKEGTRIITLVAEHTVDSLLLKAMAKKQDVVDYVKGAIGRRSAEVLGG